MNIPKAIKILKSEQKHGVIANMDDWNDAVKLGIEALKEIKEAREAGGTLTGFLLPSETEEEK